MKRLIILLLMAFSPAALKAEFFIDAFGGLAYTQSGSFYAMRQDDTIFSLDGDDLSGSTGLAGGLRGGYWFKDPNWLGVALDFANFNADAQYSNADVSFGSFSLMLMLRFPLLVSEDFHHGRFQPYAGVGASMAFGTISSSSVDVPSSLDDDSGSGFVFCSGVKWFLTRHVGFFVEYRYVSASFDQNAAWQSGSLLWPRYDHYYQAEGDAHAHLFLGGVSYHF